MSRSIYSQFFVLYLILRCFGMFPYCIHKSKLKIKLIQRKRDMVLNNILLFAYLCYFSWILFQCLDNSDKITTGKRIHLYINTILLYINCFNFLSMFVNIFERLDKFDTKMICPDIKNRLFLIHIGCKLFIYLLFISQDVLFYMTQNSTYAPFQCVSSVYLQNWMETSQEALYIFAISLITDRVIFLKTKIRGVKCKNVKIFLRALMELKENFQLVNLYFSMPLLLKMINNFAGCLVAVNFLIDYINGKMTYIAELSFLCIWILILVFEVLLLFYCLDHCLTAVR